MSYFTGQNVKEVASGLWSEATVLIFQVVPNSQVILKTGFTVFMYNSPSLKGHSVEKTPPLERTHFWQQVQ